ncbi:MAG: hypothetical protein LBQ73_06910, partial [Tannerellaceae bacterium]|nr:hypothetical protein [Tannerellaceae bacterium]
MREIKFAGIIYLVMSFISCQSPNNFDGAIAVWSFAGLHDNTEEDSRLEIHGDVSFVSLTGEEVKASNARGGDGIVARING